MCLSLAKIGAALLFRHRHADGGAGLAGGAHLPPVIAGRGDELAPFGPARRIAAQDRNGRIGHADRAANAVLGLIPHVGQRAARHLRAGTRIVPAQRMGLVTDGERHQLVPGRMKIDPIDAVAEAVVGAQLGQMTVGLAGKLLDVRRADRRVPPRAIFDPPMPRRRFALRDRKSDRRRRHRNRQVPAAG